MESYNIWMNGKCKLLTTINSCRNKGK
jgi:hypothetical protein